MQVCIDFGLTNFQGGKAKIYRELCKNTPPSVMNRCNLITSIPLPRELPPGAARSILLHPLSEMGVSCIDTLRIDWKPSSPYFLDLLDVATDLQREGIIRSIAGKRIPNSALRRAHSCGFRVETNQIPANLLDPCAFYNSDSLLMVHDTHTKLIIENPAAGGLLSSRYFNRPGEPYKFEMTTTERKNLRSLYKWQGRQESGMKSSWRLFQSKVMDTLHDISLKHQVPLDVVVHRWALQLEGVAGTVASCEFRDGNDLGAQPKKLRKVFQLNLDEEDCAQLWKASGCERPTSDIPAIDLHEVEQGDNGPFFPPGAKLLWI
jgi:aryl-alcohol dehydrogenase-like predicted oxidoreductase